MSDDQTYNLLCRVAMGVSLSASDRASLKADKLIEDKTLITPKGQALMKAADAAKMTPVVVQESDIDRLLREFPAFSDAESGLPAIMFVDNRETFHKLAPYRAAHLVEIGVMATVYEWGDSPHDRRLAPGNIARLSKWALAFLEDRRISQNEALDRQFLASLPPAGSA